MREHEKDADLHKIDWLTVFGESVTKKQQKKSLLPALETGKRLSHISSLLGLLRGDQDRDERCHATVRRI